jgi:glycosyltransferase involved in cell wall biosynthesis
VPRRGAQDRITAGRSTFPSISIVMPVLNESRNLPHVMSNLPKDCELVLVDGHSVDDTVEVAKALRPDLVFVMQNRTGKGNALACGFEACSGDVIVMLDADGSNAPAEIPRFVDALVAGADFAKGSRFVDGGGSSDLTWLRSTGNRALSGIVNMVYRERFSDLCYGYMAFWRDVLPSFRLSAETPGGGRQWGDGFEIETLLNVRASLASLNVVEVPSFEHARMYGVSNLRAASDGLRVLRTITRERLVRPERSRRPSAGDLVEEPFPSTDGVHLDQAILLLED